MIDLPAVLVRALETELAGHSFRDLGRAAEDLSHRYRADRPANEPILDSELKVAAYMTTRMPATYAAARHVFERLAAADPGFAPRTMLDLGAGTGACTWAAAEAFPSLEASHLVDSSPAALAPALRLLASSGLHITHAAAPLAASETAPAGQSFDLAVAGYLLGEVEADVQSEVVGTLVRAAPVVTVIEPGTVAGYARVLEARERLINAEHHVLAPCPHDGICPLAQTDDWCHFAVRLTRSLRHRRVKGGDLGYEDEKYSYVISRQAPASPRPARILRHPQVRTGHVRITLCDNAAAGVQQITLSKRHGPRYRAARHAAWGDPWPPANAIEPMP